MLGKNTPKQKTNRSWNLDKSMGIAFTASRTDRKVHTTGQMINKSLCRAVQSVFSQIVSHLLRRANH